MVDFVLFFGRFLSKNEWPEEGGETGGPQNYTLVFLQVQRASKTIIRMWRKIFLDLFEINPNCL